MFSAWERSLLKLKFKTRHCPMLQALPVVFRVTWVVRLLSQMETRWILAGVLAGILAGVLAVILRGRSPDGAQN